MIDTMDPHEREAAEDQLRVDEVLDAALARRNEILELVSSSADPDEAEERIRDLLDVQVPGLSRVVLDMQVFRLTGSEREKLSERTRELRRLVRHRTTHRRPDRRSAHLGSLGFSAAAAAYAAGLTIPGQDLRRLAWFRAAGHVHLNVTRR